MNAVKTCWILALNFGAVMASRSVSPKPTQNLSSFKESPSSETQQAPLLVAFECRASGMSIMMMQGSATPYRLRRRRAHAKITIAFPRQMATIAPLEPTLCRLI